MKTLGKLPGLALLRRAIGKIMAGVTNSDSPYGEKYSGRLGSSPSDSRKRVATAGNGDAKKDCPRADDETALNASDEALYADYCEGRVAFEESARRSSVTTRRRRALYRVRPFVRTFFFLYFPTLFKKGRGIAEAGTSRSSWRTMEDAGRQAGKPVLITGARLLDLSYF